MSRDSTKRRRSAAGRLAVDLHELAVELACRFSESDIQEIERDLTQAQKSGELRTYLARLWRIDRFARFKDRQLRKREWINFGEIVDWCSQLGGTAERDEARRANAYSWLQEDLLAGDFEDAAGRSRVLYLFHRITRVRMTRDNWLIIVGTHPADISRSEFLDRCWLERPMFQRWLAKHELPLSPPRFEPRKGETKIETPPPGRKPGQKPHVRNAVGAYVAKLYPDGVPANVTTKMIAQHFESSRDGFRVSPRTVSRALGRR